MDNFEELKCGDYQKIIESMSEQIQNLIMELSSVLCDVSRYLNEEESEEVRNTDPRDFINSLLNNEWYQLFVQNDLEGYDPLMDQEYLDEVSGNLCDEDEDLFYPSFYSRRNLRGVQ